MSQTQQGKTQPGQTQPRFGQQRYGQQRPRRDRKPREEEPWIPTAEVGERAVRLIVERATAQVKDRLDNPKDYYEHGLRL